MLLARRHAVVLGAALTGLVLSSGPAAAAPPPTVTFTGSCGIAGSPAESEPDTDSLTVPGEGLVVFVNHLDEKATLLVDDRPAGSLRANEEVPVVFHRGPVMVKLVPACLPALDANEVIVVVTQPAGAPGVSAAERADAGSAQPAVRSSSAAQAPPGRRASRILVLVAVICVAGVSFATIRAIIIQRAIRTASA